MTLTYEALEREVLSLQRIKDTENLVNAIKGQEIQISDIEGIMNESNLWVSSLFSANEDRLYLNQDIYTNLQTFVDDTPVSNYKGIYELNEMLPINILEHFMQSKPIKEVTDIEILNKIYGKQTQTTYKKLKKVVEVAKQKELPLPINLLLELPMITKEEEIYNYTRILDLYFDRHMEFTLVSLRTPDGHEYSHIKMEVLTTGEVLYKVSANPGKISEEWVTYLVPFHNIGHLMELSLMNTLILEVKPKDLIYSKNIGKLSGVPKNTALDNKIYEFLRINDLYSKGTFTPFEAGVSRKNTEVVTQSLTWT